MTQYKERYVRNTLFTQKEQADLANAHVLIVGLGGLGGYVLDMLARTGIGHITGADGDVFEASNLNRQILCTEARLGQSKAMVAAEHVQAVNSSVRFTPLPYFLQGASLLEATQGVDIIVDALGGFKDRKTLQDAATSSQKILVSAGIAGFTGWVAIIKPHAPSPCGFMDADNNAEISLGNLAPTAATAASLQVSAVLQILLHRMPDENMNTMTIFDLAQAYQTTVTL